MPDNSKAIRISVTLPVDLIERSQEFIENGTFRSRNSLITAALERLLLNLERQEIDRQFEAMANDFEYLLLNEQIAESFAESDWEALATTPNPSAPARQTTT